MKYNLYKHDYLECPFCNKHVKLYYSKSHLKTKKCFDLQNMLEKNDYEKMFILFIQEINKIKSNLNGEEEQPVKG